MHTLRQRILAHLRILIIPLRLAWREGRNRWTLLLLAAMLPAVVLNAQVTTGSVNGRVQDPTTGRFLNNAKVSVVGSTATTQTDEYGEYQLNGIPAGVAKLKAFYTGLGEQEVAVTVQAGKTVTQDIVFDEKAAGESSVVLDTFTVASHRNTDVASIAVNEQRFSPNIKTVIETDAFGDIAEGNIGEFLKFLPGVTVDYVAADVRTVSVRGFGSAFSSVSIDGFRMASASSGASARAFEFEQVSINNAARVEVLKVPLPSTPADVLGGAVNLISKNSFERAGAQFNYRAYVNMNSEDPTVKKSPGPGRKNTYKVLPGFDFDYTIPVTKNLGFVVTGLSSNQFNEQHRTQKTWNFAQSGATPTNPFLQNYVMQDGPKNSFRDSISVKMDWRISPGSTLWVGLQSNYYKSFFGNRNLTWEAGSNGTPSPSSGIPLTYGEDFTEGATGRGSVRQGGSFRDKLGATSALLAKYRFVGENWEFDAGAGASESRTWYRDTGRGHFSEVRTTLQGVSRVTFADIQEERPSVINALTAGGASVDYTDEGNYRLNTVRSVPLDAKDEYRDLHANLKRKLNMLPFDADLQAGFDIRQQKRDIRKYDTTWNFVGKDGLTNTADDNAAAYADDKYGVYSGWGFSGQQWYDPYTLYDLFVSSPNNFAQTADQVRNAERFRIQNSSNLTETVSAAYLQAEGHFLQNRLSVITGVRFEKTSDEGDGPLTPNSGSTLAIVQSTWRERGYKVDDSYDGYYPSLHVNFNITDNLILRAAYASTIGRPDFGNILPLVRVNPDTTAADDGAGSLAAQTISYNNTALKPYTADNYDLALEYYFRNGGLFSVGVFRKDIDNFFESSATIATTEDVARLGLDPAFVGFDLLTDVNSTSSARITGGEVNFRQPLKFIPGVGQYLTFFANATKLDLDGSASADFSGFIEESFNSGITFSRKPLTLRLNMNYRGRQINSSQTGSQYGSANGFHEYYDDRVTFDVNAAYVFSKRIELFANVRNIFNKPQDLQRYNDTSPGYSNLYRREKFGAQITIGVKGTF
jgi:TonB-dependent receptor